MEDCREKKFPHILEMNAKILRGGETEERKIECHDNFEGTV